MRPLNTIIAVSVAFGLVLASGCGKGGSTRDAGNAGKPDAVKNDVKPAEPEGPEALDLTKCVATIEVDKASSYLTEIRSKMGFDLPDYVKSFPALPVDKKKAKPLESGSSIRIDDDPLFWWNPETKQAFVDERFFGDLAVVDVPRMAVGDEAAIGTFKGRVKNLIPPRQLVELLIRAGVLQTFWHLEAKVCLVEETGGETSYTGSFAAEHVYFTSEENRDTYSFDVTVGQDGAMTVKRK